MSYESYIAKRYLKSRGRSRLVSVVTVISILGVFVGVMALIIVRGVLQGFEDEVRDKIVGTNAHVVVLKYGNEPIEDYDRVTQVVEEMDGVVAAAPFVYSKGVVKGTLGSDGVVIRGARLEEEKEVTDILDNIKPQLQTLESGPDQLPLVVPGLGLASRLHIAIGDTVMLSTPFEVVITPMGLVPRIRKYRVAGFFESGMMEYDDSLVYLSLSAAQSLFGMDEGVTGIEVKVADMYQAPEIGDGIVDRLGGFPFRANDWIHLNRNLFTWMEIDKLVQTIILSLIVLVAAFNIAGTLIMVVMEKTKEIGILKSMGATSGGIMRIFVFEGLMVALIGTVLGCTGGFVLGYFLDKYELISLPGDVYFIETLPVKMQVLDFLLIPLGAILICLLASLYPARRASRMDPIEAIRYE
jgi:lipoprotein-releasing system permease protein